MKKITVFVGMLAMVAFFATSVVAQDKTKDTKTTTTQVKKTDAKAPASTDKKTGTSKEACKPGCTMHKDKCCDKSKSETPAPEKK